MGTGHNPATRLVAPDLVTVIEPPTGLIKLNLREMWEYRELLQFLVWRDVQSRYRQMAFGPLWILIAPLIQMVVFTVLLGNLAGLPSDGVPYPIYIYAGLLPWQFFTSALRQSAGSLVAGRDLIGKIYFPRVLLPASAVMAALVDLGASSVIMIGMMFVFRTAPSSSVWMVPLYITTIAALGFGVGLWLAALAVRYHDVNLAVGFGLDIWKFATPVVYSLAIIPEQWRGVYLLNPIAPLIDGLRAILVASTTPPTWSVVLAAGTTVVLLASGLAAFSVGERNVVDVM